MNFKYIEERQELIQNVRRNQKFEKQLKQRNKHIEELEKENKETCCKLSRLKIRL